MAAKILDGKAIAQDIRERLRGRVEDLARHGAQPGLGVVLVGDDPASTSYVNAKERACEDLGIKSVDHRLPESTSEAELLGIVEELNQDQTVHGILVQLPLPDHISADRVTMAIDPDKDVDGFHPVNLGRLLRGQECFWPCTPHGVIEILRAGGVKTEGKHAVIVGRSNIVGKPLATMLMQKSETGNATVTVCHTRTPNIAEHTRQGDIVIAAAGKPATVTGDMLKPGAVAIDVGVNRVEDASKKKGYRLVGDIDFDSASEVASMITPVPGGVGPLTITMLLANTVLSAERRREQAGR